MSVRDRVPLSKQHLMDNARGDDMGAPEGKSKRLKDDSTFPSHTMQNDIASELDDVGDT